MMHRFLKGLLLTSALIVAVSARGASGDSRVSFERREGQLDIRIDGRPFARYVWSDPKILRPYFADLRAPNGTQVTRNNPPIAGQDADDHATMHPGLWLGFGDLSGADFWRNKGRVEQLEFVAAPVADENGGTFAVRNRYFAGDNPVCDELCRVAIRHLPAGRLVDWSSEFSGATEFAFGDQEEMGLGIRMATPLTVKNGGRIINSDGLINESQAWGKQADWCDYSGTIDGESAGILIMPDPENFRRSWFHARDYGVLVANPFGQNAFTKGEKSRVVVRPGEKLQLRYGILIHSGSTDLGTAYRDWRKASRP
jgi:hypothetical protein